MSDAVIVALVSGGLALLGTIFTTICAGVGNRKKIVQRIDEVEKKLDEHIKDDGWRAAKQARIRILRFDDELCRGVKHSENHFEDIIEDIDDYESFCDKHPDFKNNKGRAAMSHIKAVYSECKLKKSFLI